MSFEIAASAVPKRDRILSDEENRALRELTPLAARSGGADCSWIVGQPEVIRLIGTPDR